MAVNHEPIGVRIRTLPQKQLAKADGLSAGAITNFEKGRRRISVEWLTKIADALDTPVAYFLEDKSRRSSGRPKERQLLRAWRELAPDLQRDFLRFIIDVSKQRRRRT